MLQQLGTLLRQIRDQNHAQAIDSVKRMIENYKDQCKDHYVLVLWPESQQFMDEPWFQDECELCKDASYFIPVVRYQEFMSKEESVFKGNIANS